MIDLTFSYRNVLTSDGFPGVSWFEPIAVMFNYDFGHRHFDFEPNTVILRRQGRYVFLTPKALSSRRHILLLIKLLE